MNADGLDAFMKYKIKAYDSDDREFDIEIEAEDRSSATELIRDRGLVPFDIIEQQASEPPTAGASDSPHRPADPSNESVKCIKCNSTSVQIIAGPDDYAHINFNTCMHCGTQWVPGTSTTLQLLRVQASELFVKKVALIIAAGLIFLILFSLMYPSSPVKRAPSRSYTSRTTSVPQYEDPRDKRWEKHPEIIRAAAKEAGVSDADVRRAFNDELDRRGLSDWADGKE